jgi:hypothetical protein
MPGGSLFGVFAGRASPMGRQRPGKRAIFASLLLAFTLAPHLQPINHRGCFSPLAGI